MKNFKFILPIMLVLVGFAFTSKVEATQIKSASVTLGDSRPNQSSTYLFAFTHTSANTIKSVSFDFCKVASDVGSTCPNPITTGTIPATPTIDAVSANLGVAGDWAAATASKVITVTHSGTGIVLGADAAISFTLSGLTNSTLAEACDGTAGTDTCFVWIKTYTPTPTLVDTGVVTYTVVEAVQVTAKVDPTFTFVVAGVNAGTVNNQITTSVNSTSNSLPFGSLQAGTPKYMAHALYVTTNTGSGYSITAKMATQMTGVDTDNNIDPFVAPWLTATTWTEPTGGGPNVDTAWFGGNTTDTDITGWESGALKFGGIGTGAFVEVSKKLSSDNGTVPVYVSYAIEANVFQPSDFYTGTLIYNALPTY